MLVYFSKLTVREHNLEAIASRRFKGPKGLVKRQTARCRLFGTIGKFMTATSCLTEGGLFVAFFSLEMLIRINAPSSTNKSAQTAPFSFPTV
jgi:hypothetical protein